MRGVPNPSLLDNEIDTGIIENCEGMSVRVIRDYPVNDATCNHVVDGKIPRAIRALNEGGYNFTVVCLDCILEWATNNER
jgi:hypothetical protein